VEDSGRKDDTAHQKDGKQTASTNGDSDKNDNDKHTNGNDEKKE